MKNTYRLNLSELTTDFIDRLKAEYGDRDLEITITPIDETDYLLANPANRNRLLDAIENIQNPANCISLTMDELV
jgi:antitoxin YefM